MPNPKIPALAEDDLKWVTCAICRQDCLGESMMVRPRLLPKEYRKSRHIVVRVGNRPRCNECVARGWSAEEERRQMDRMPKPSDL